MGKHFIVIVAFVILFPIIFFGALVYHKSFGFLKKAIRLDFKDIEKIELWMSFFISLIITAIISYSLL